MTDTAQPALPPRLQAAGHDTIAAVNALDAAMMDQSVRGNLVDTAAALTTAGDPATAATLTSYVQVRGRRGTQLAGRLLSCPRMVAVPSIFSLACRPRHPTNHPHPLQAIDSTHNALAGFSSFGSDLDSIQQNTAGTIDQKIQEYRDTMDTADAWCAYSLAGSVACLLSWSAALLSLCILRRCMPFTVCLI